MGITRASLPGNQPIGLLPNQARIAKEAGIDIGDWIERGDAYLIGLIPTGLPTDAPKALGASDPAPEPLSAPVGISRQVRRQIERDRIKRLGLNKPRPMTGFPRRDEILDEINRRRRD